MRGAGRGRVREMIRRTATVWVLLLGCRPGTKEPLQGPVAASAVGPAGAGAATVAGPAATAPPAVAPAGASSPERAAAPEPAAANWIVGSINGDEPQGSLDKDVIRQVVRGRIGDIRECYNRGLASDASLTGRVTVQFMIGGSGAVISAVVQASTLPVHGEPVARCIATAAGKWVFPEPEGGGRVIVTYPFVLTSEDPVMSLAGLVAGKQSPGQWFPVADQPSDSLLVEVLTAGGKAPVRGVEVTLTLYSPDGTRSAVTDERGLVVFAGVIGSSGSVSIAGATHGTRYSSEAVVMGRGAMATLLVQPVAPAKR